MNYAFPVSEGPLVDKVAVEHAHRFYDAYANYIATKGPHKNRVLFGVPIGFDANDINEAPRPVSSLATRALRALFARRPDAPTVDVKAE
ncbi:MAG: hypothetical protein MHM6MM_006438 [Cercozoa sp. M6MM]